MAVASRRRWAAPRLLYAASLLLPLDAPPDNGLVLADRAHVVAPRPQRAVPARRPPQLGVPLVQDDRAPAL